MTKSGTRQIRIIGGKWRSRKVRFADHADIRPTPDRIRETLFNWLAADVADSRTLELYAGSGILSMEALSRGAKQSVIIDQTAGIVRNIHDNLVDLGCDPRAFNLVTSRAIDWIHTRSSVLEEGQQYDLIFMDPPFKSDELSQVPDLIEKFGLLAPEGLVYLECSHQLGKLKLPDNWRELRQKTAGKVSYSLFQRES